MVSNVCLERMIRFVSFGIKIPQRHAFKIGHVIWFVGSTGYVEQANVACKEVEMFEYSCDIHLTRDVIRCDCLDDTLYRSTTTRRRYMRWECFWKATWHNVSCQVVGNSKFEASSTCFIVRAQLNQVVWVVTLARRQDKGPLDVVCRVELIKGNLKVGWKFIVSLWEWSRLDM